MKNFVKHQYRSLLQSCLATSTVCFGLHLEAATLTVTNLADSGPGTLRARIAAAAPGDQINFAVSGKIVLNSELAISNNLTIQGLGAQFLQISGNNSTRVFRIVSGTTGMGSMVISDGRVVGTNGAAGLKGQDISGGAILVQSGAVLALSSVVLSNNTVMGGQGGSQNQMGAAGNGGNGFGGAIANYGRVTVSAGQFIRNSAIGGFGGVAPTGSPGVGGQGWGGAFYSDGMASFTWTTMCSNNATAGTGGGGPGGGVGGAIFNAGSMGMFLMTLAHNVASGSSFDSGGAIQSSGAVLIRDGTIAGNQADYGGGLSGSGFDLGNTILAGNSAANGPDGNGSILSSDYNLIQTTNALAITGTTTHNILGQNPLLGPLQDNGGGEFGFTTLTMAPLPGSPVIDKGNGTSNGDQRLFQRPYDTSIPNTGNGSDIGAVEINPATFIVVNNLDSGAGSLRQALENNNGLGGGNTIIFSNIVAGTITLTGGELVVVAPAIIRGPGPSMLAISANHNGRVFDIREPAEISGLTIRDGLVGGTAGSPGVNGFDERGGGIYNQSTLMLSNCLVLSNSVVGGMGGESHLGFAGNGGKATGGGLHNAGGNLFLTKCSFIGNSAVGGQGGNGVNGGDAGGAGNGIGGTISTLGGTTVVSTCSISTSLAKGGTGGISSGGANGIGGQGYGGGIYSESSLLLSGSTVHSSAAMGGPGGGGDGGGSGGGIYNLTDLGMYSCTIASNSASGSSFDFGGGISSLGTMGTTNCTIAGNQADYGGGMDGNANAANTIFAANTASHSADVNGTINSFDYNLVQSFAGANIVGATAHVLIGQDPLLGPLQNNGGPTLTMALLAGSPAIDKGKSFGPLTDQRGVVRPYDLPSVANAGGGDGNDIGAFEFLPIPQLKIQRAANNVVLSWSTDAADFRLESAANLPTVSTWLEVTNTRTYLGNQVYVTNAIAAPNQFYRLSFPAFPVFNP